jgi:hypothetical protein
MSNIRLNVACGQANVEQLAPGAGTAPGVRFAGAKPWNYSPDRHCGLGFIRTGFIRKLAGCAIPQVLGPLSASIMAIWIGAATG